MSQAEAGKPRGRLPKAYLRIDPNIDQTHSDCGAFVKLLCAGNRQPIRGRFKTWEILVNAVGRRSALKHRDVWKDVHQDGEALVIDGWDIWQEGDFTVGERMQLMRDRKRNKTVTPDVTEPPGNRNGPSEALGVKASGTDAADVSDSSPPETDPPFRESAPAVETTGRKRLSLEQRQEYADAVWQAFLARSGTPRAVMSPKEFALVASWIEEVPLRFVLQGIQDCAGTGGSLNYYADAVREEYERWRQAVPA